jgi:hypothetical protein
LEKKKIADGGRGSGICIGISRFFNGAFGCFLILNLDMQPCLNSIEDHFKHCPYNGVIIPSKPI